MMEPVIARRSIKQYAAGVVFGAIGAAVMHRGGASWEASALVWLAVALVPPVVGALRAALDQDEVLRIDDAGVLDRRLHVGTIPWPQIAGVERVGGKLRIDLTDPELMERENARRPWYTRPLTRRGEPALYVGVSGLDVDAKRLEEAVRAHLSLWR